VKQSTLLQQRIADVRRFRDAYRLLLDDAQFYEEVGGGGGFYAAPTDDQATFDQRLSELAILAGVAMRASADADTRIIQYGRDYSPLMQWRDPFRADGGLASATDVLDACGRTIGVLEAQLAEARSVERTLASKVGRLLSFPARARQAAGGGRSHQRLAFWGSLTTQVLAGLIVAGIITGLAIVFRNAV